MEPIPNVFGRATTAMVSDALDELGIDGVLVGLTARHGRPTTTVGRALPVRFVARGGDESAYRFGGGVGRPLEAVLKSMETGHFVVFDLDRSPRAACWGGLASRLATDRGVAGVAIWGCCRDVEEIRSQGFPVWSTGVCPRRSRNDFTFGSIGESITIDGAMIGSGDVVVGDPTGVVVVPRDREQEVATTLIRIIDQEATLEKQLDHTDGEIDWDAI